MVAFGGHLLRRDPGMLLDSSKNIDKAYLGSECVAMVDVGVATRTIPAMNWHAMRQMDDKHTAILRNHGTQFPSTVPGTHQVFTSHKYITDK